MFILQVTGTASSNGIAIQIFHRYAAHIKYEDETRIAANLAKITTMIRIRNTRLEELHAGLQPVTLTGDYSDVTVVDATGRTICWKDVSHIDDARMADLMRDDPSFRDHLDRWMTASDKWDNPALDIAFLDAVARLGTPPKT